MIMFAESPGLVIYIFISLLSAQILCGKFYLTMLIIIHNEMGR